MKLKSDLEDVYDRLTMEWLYSVAAIMKPHLMSAGLSAEKAEEVGGNILFDLGMLHDDGEIREAGEDGQKQDFIPRIAFVTEGGDLIATGDDSFLHEYAIGANGSAYEEG